MAAAKPRTAAGKADKVARTMREWKAGQLRSGSKKGPLVRGQRQAVAIALSQAGQSKPKGKRPPLSKTGGHRVANRLSKALSKRVEAGAARAK